MKLGVRTSLGSGSWATGRSYVLRTGYLVGQTPTEDMAEKRAPMRDTWRPWTPAGLENWTKNSYTDGDWLLYSEVPLFFCRYFFFSEKSRFPGLIKNHCAGPDLTLPPSFCKNPSPFFIATGSAPWILFGKNT